MHGLEPSKEFGCAPFFEAGAIGDTFLLGESETSSFGVSDRARLFGVDRTKAGEDMSSKKDLA
jgi:hypothetical protein